MVTQKGKITVQAEVKTAIDMAKAILQMNAAGEPQRIVDDRVHDFLFFVSTEIDTTGIADFDTVQFSDAVDVLREHVFMRHPTANLTESINKVLAAYEWPPVMPQIAIVVNLVRSFMRDGIKVDFFYDRPCQGIVNGKEMSFENGWQVFVETYGKAIIAV